MKLDAFFFIGRKEGHHRWCMSNGKGSERLAVEIAYIPRMQCQNWVFCIFAEKVQSSHQFWRNISNRMVVVRCTRYFTVFIIGRRWEIEKRSNW